MARVTSANSDTYREIKILELDINEDECTYNSKAVDVNYLPTVECFSQQSLDKQSGRVDRIDYNSSLEDILSNLNFSIQSSIFDIIDEMALDTDILQTLENYLKANFIERK